MFRHHQLSPICYNSQRMDGSHWWLHHLCIICNRSLPPRLKEYKALIISQHIYYSYTSGRQNTHAGEIWHKSLISNYSKFLESFEDFSPQCLHITWLKTTEGHRDAIVAWPRSHIALFWRITLLIFVFRGQKSCTIVFAVLPLRLYGDSTYRLADVSAREEPGDSPAEQIVCTMCKSVDYCWLAVSWKKAWLENIQHMVHRRYWASTADYLLYQLSNSYPMYGGEENLEYKLQRPRPGFIKCLSTPRLE